MPRVGLDPDVVSLPRSGLTRQRDLAMLAIDPAGGDTIHIDGTLGAHVDGEDQTAAVCLCRRSHLATEPAALPLGAPTRTLGHRPLVAVHGFREAQRLVGHKATPLDAPQGRKELAGENFAPVVEAMTPFKIQ